MFVLQCPLKSRAKNKSWDCEHSMKTQRKEMGKDRGSSRADDVSSLYIFVSRNLVNSITVVLENFNFFLIKINFFWCFQ